MPMLPFAETSSPPDPTASGPAVDPAEPPESGAEPTVAEEVHTALIQVLPWGISIVFHAALVLLAVFAVWSTIIHPSEEEVVVPLVRLSDTPGAPLEMTEIRRLDQPRVDRRTIQQADRSQDQPLTQKVELTTPLIGVEGLTGAKAAPFNTAIDASAQFKTNFFGAGGNARKIAFLVDATGSLTDSFPFITGELIRTINGLNDRQQYVIIFFNGNGVAEVPPNGWKVGNADNKTRTVEWLNETANIRVGGKANPVRALERALQLRPDLVYLLSDNITGQGRFLIEQEELLREIKRLNASSTRINTIQFIYEDPVKQFGGESTMELIARQTGGVYRFVKESELFLR